MTSAWDQHKHDVADAARRMADLGLVVGTAGNVSARVERDAAEDLMAVTPSGVPLLRLDRRRHRDYRLRRRPARRRSSPVLREPPTRRHLPRPSRRSGRHPHPLCILKRPCRAGHRPALRYRRSGRIRRRRSTSIRLRLSPAPKSCPPTSAPLSDPGRPLSSPTTAQSPSEGLSTKPSTSACSWSARRRYT